MHITCGTCGQRYEIAATEAEVAGWRDFRVRGGPMIQEAFPHLSADERELLLSGTCGTCFDTLANELEQEEDDE